MQEVKLQAKARQANRKELNALKESGDIPGVIYGQGEEATPVAIPAKELEQAYMTAGTNRLIELTVDGDKPVTTLFIDVQHNPVNGELRHFDLYKVKMDEEIETEIPIHFEGEAPATYNLDGILVKNLEEVVVKALPNKLPESFTVSLDPLEEINAAIHVSDLDIPEGVTVITEEDTLVVKIDPPRSEEELEELDEAIDEDAESAVESEHGAEEAEEGAEDAAGGKEESEKSDSEQEKPDKEE